MPTFQPDAAAGKDTYLLSNAADNNYGIGTLIAVGDSSTAANNAVTALIAFDLSSIPSTATVTAVTLSLFEYDAYDTASVGSWAVPMQRMLVDWDEGTVNAAPGDASWNERTSGTAWTTAGARSDGNDRAADVSATLTLDGTAAAAFVDWSGATLTADVQGFVNGSLANYGWQLTAPTAEMKGVVPRSGNRFYASDYATDPAKRPKLVVEYITAQVPAHYYRTRRVA